METMTFDEIITLALNAVEFEGLAMDGLFSFFVDCGLSDYDASDCLGVIESELKLAA